MSAIKGNSKIQTGRRIRRIAFFAPTGSEYVTRLAEGVFRYQSEHQHCVVREFRYNAEEPEDQERWAARPRPWDSWAADGLLVHISADPGLAEWVAAGGQPVVNTGTGPDLVTVCVSSNDVVIKAIRHFRACGLSNFAFVTQHSISRLGDLFQTRLNEGGMSLRRVLVGINPSEWDFSAEEAAAGDPALGALLLTAPKPLAVLANNDEVGRVVCLVAGRLGLNVPRDLAVLGVGDYALARSANPPLSSIHTPGEDVGYRAMELLERMIDGEPAPRLVEVPSGRVVIRETTALLRGKNRDADVTRALQIIRDRACEGVGIKDILGSLDMSESTLHREFKRRVGRSVGDEITRVRVDRAKELLQMNSLSVTQVAAAVGYASHSNFTVFFKSQTGITPAEYRRQHRATR